MSETQEGASIAEPKLQITLCDGMLIEICDSIEAALAARDGELFQHKGAIYLQSSHGAIKADALLLRLRALRIADFFKSRRGSFEAIDPPLKYFQALLRKGVWKFAELDEVRPRQGR